MRRSMNCLIVALLCLTLFVDSAKACWWLRQHRSRSQVCRPSACRPASPPCCAVSGETVEHDGCVTQVIETVVAEENALAYGAVEHGTVVRADRVEESVVVHGPTTLVDAAPARPAPGVPEPTSVVTPPAADKPIPPVAQPMPLASASPAAIPTPTVPQEPLPDLKPADAPASAVAPASNEQPMPEPPAAAPAPTAPTTPAAAAAEPAEPADEDEPMPAPAEALAGGPELKTPVREPQEPNLFDLFGDEGDEDVPSEEAPDEKPGPIEGDSGEPADESASESSPEDEPEMTEADDEAAAEAEATDGDSETTGEPAAETSDPAAEPAAAETDDEPEQAEPDPAAAAMAVPNEPMRRWTDDTGTHHAQGWLVEVQADRVRILKVNGRHTTMLTESLSTADRDYVSAVGARLAAERQGTGPAPTATAGL